jgi:F-type H+-transporting ATPase subunit b
MLIDWFTVAAQIINFLILVLLLRRFLYRPVIRAMSEREAQIAAQIEDAKLLRQEAVEAAESYRQQRKELDNFRDALLSEAREDAERWRKDTIHKAREEIDEARNRWHKSIVAEKHAFMRELRQRIGSQVCTISRQALADLADAELEQQMIEVFVQRLQSLDEAERAVLRQSAQRSDKEVILRSAFDIPTDMRRRLVETFHSRIAGGVEMRFEVVPDLLCGVEISSQDYKLAWTLNDYLVSLEERLFETFDEVTEPEPHV